MPSNEPVPIAIIGCGGMARHHLRGYRELAETVPNLVEIIATCDVDEGRAQALAQEIAQFQPATPPQVCTDVSRLLAEGQPVAVDVVLPHAAHHTVVCAALAAGAHVLVEKPFALTIAAGRRMLATAEQVAKDRPQVLAVAEQARRDKGARMLRWAIHDAGLIGEPRMIFAQNVSWSLGVVVGTPWRHQRLQAGGGWVLDGEVHYFDLLRYVFGDVREVYARVHNFEATRYLNPDEQTDPVPSDVEDAAVALLTFESGITANFVWTTAAAGRGFRHRRYYGSAGCIDDDGLRRNDGTEKTTTELAQLFLDALPSEQREQLFPHGITNPITLELYDFATAVRDGRAPEIDGYEGLADQAVSTAIYESHQAGVPVIVADVLSGQIRAAQRDIDAHWGLL